MVGLADVAGFDEVGDVPHGGDEAVGEGGHVTDVGLVGGVEHLPRLGEAHGDGLLAEDVLAGLRGGDGDGGVGDVGGGDDDGVDAGVLEDVLVVGEGGAEAGLLLGAIEDGGVGVAEGDDLAWGRSAKPGRWFCRAMPPQPIMATPILSKVVPRG